MNNTIVIKKIDSATDKIFDKWASVHDMNKDSLLVFDLKCALYDAFMLGAVNGGHNQINRLALHLYIILLMNIHS